MFQKEGRYVVVTLFPYNILKILKKKIAVISNHRLLVFFNFFSVSQVLRRV